MTNFTSKQKSDTANAATGTLIGFKGGTLAQLQDTTADRFSAGGGNDTVVAASGNDTIDGGKGNDSLNGGAGNDTIIGGMGNDRIIGGPGIDSIDAGSNDDTILVFQGHGVDSIDGGSGTDLLDLSGLTSSGAIADLAAGQWTLDSANATLINVEHITGGGGNDSINGSSAANRLLGGGGNDTLSGGSGTDTLDGGTGNDLLLGGANPDSISGGAGNDTIVIAAGEAGDTLAGGADTDLLDFSGLTTIAATVNLQAGTWATAASATQGTVSGIENVTGGGAADTLTGDSAANRLDGGAGNDTLRGGGGIDTIMGGGGNDTILLAQGEAGDNVDGGAGADLLDLSGLTGNTAVIDLQAGTWSTSASAATLAIANVESLAGGGGDDLLQGDSIGNTLSGGGGNDALAGRDGDDVLNGGVGNDTLDGGVGLDTASGGDGEDVFVFNAGDLAAGDSIDGGAGTDAIQVGTNAATATKFDLRGLAFASIETLDFSEFADVKKTIIVTAAQMDGIGAVNGNLGAADQVTVRMATRNTLDLSTLTFTDWLAGGTEKDIVTIAGKAGAENIKGSSVRDAIMGFAGNDTLDGGGGRDTLKGGLGNDLYFVNAKAEAVEKAGQGIDTVRSTVSYTLGKNIEHLQLLGTGNLKGTGNELANRITGNAGNNLLNGKLGADTLAGGAGNDTYVFSAGDKVVEKAGQGTDTVKSTVTHKLLANVENLVLTGKANVSGTGNGLGNVITGNGGTNKLDGKAGSDTLKGGAGADKFVFTTALNATTNVDTIKDFAVNVDKIMLENAIFKGLAAGKLAAAAFTIGNAAKDAGDHIIYNKTTGALFFDIDGTGAAAKIQFAKLAPNLTMDAGDFLVI